jgi:hypothetical protein
VKKLLKLQFVVPLAVAYLLVAVIIAGPWFALFTGGLLALVAALALWLSPKRVRQRAGAGVAVLAVALCASGYVVGAQPAWLRPSIALDAVPADDQSTMIRQTIPAAAPSTHSPSQSSVTATTTTTTATSALTPAATSASSSQPSQVATTAQAPVSTTSRTIRYVPPTTTRPQAPTTTRKTSAPTATRSSTIAPPVQPTTPSSTGTTQPSIGGLPTVVPTDVIVPSAVLPSASDQSTTPAGSQG